MKITASEPIVITPPPTTYTLILSEEEMQGLRALAFNGSEINVAEHKGCYKSDGNPANIHRVLRDFWAETNKFSDRWNR